MLPVLLWLAYAACTMVSIWIMASLHTNALLNQDRLSPVLDTILVLTLVINILTTGMFSSVLCRPLEIRLKSVNIHFSWSLTAKIGQHGTRESGRFTAAAHLFTFPVLQGEETAILSVCVLFISCNHRCI